MQKSKSSDFDKIINQMIKELPEDCIKFLTIIFISILKLKIYPQAWKLAKLILISETCKDSEYIKSYRRISLLPVVSQIFEKLF